MKQETKKVTKKNRFIVLTGVSGSGKSTVYDELYKKGCYSRPLNFTTRNPRKEVSIDEDGDFDSIEFDEYVFLTKPQFEAKLNNGDLLEDTHYGNNRYGMSAFLPEGDIVAILDPIGKAQVLNKISTDERYKDYKVECFFLDCTKDLQLERLKNRGDSQEEIDKRQKDYEWFFPSANDMVLDAGWKTSMVADLIHGFKG